MLVITPSKVKPKRAKTPGVTFLDVPYPGFSRGMGEFMDKVVTKYRKTIDNHDFIAIMGDDCEYDPVQVAHYAELYNLHWWQPAHVRGSHHTYGAMAEHRVNGIKRLPFIELNCVYSRQFLLHCAPYFDESKSGWGLDVLMGKLHMEMTGGEPSVLSEVTMRHRKPVTGGWEIDGVSSGDELRAICDKYGVSIDWERMS
jgi:hypothetical protein